MGKRKRKKYNGLALCTSCAMDEFIKCEWVHDERKIDGMKTVPILLKQGDEYCRQEKVLECPRYRAEIGREII